MLAEPHGPPENTPHKRKDRGVVRSRMSWLDIGSMILIMCLLAKAVELFGWDVALVVLRLTRAESLMWGTHYLTFQLVCHDGR